MAFDLVSILIIVLVVIGVIWIWQNHCSPKIQPVEGIDLRDIVESTEPTAMVYPEGVPVPVQPGGRPAPEYVGGLPPPPVRSGSRPSTAQTGGRPIYTEAGGLNIPGLVADPLFQQTVRDMATPFSYCSKRALRRRGNFMTRLHEMSQCLTEAGRLSY
jgi:hypothetical protein